MRASEQNKRWSKYVEEAYESLGAMEVKMDEDSTCNRVGLDPVFMVCFMELYDQYSIRYDDLFW